MQKIEDIQKLKINLQIDPVRSFTEGNGDNKKDIQTITLEFSVEEVANGVEKYFPLHQRSKGFLWFFTFVIKTSLNPKKNAQCIYLLNEPGCYLHGSAQKGLCEVFKKLSHDSVVIYNIHSHYLLHDDFHSNIRIAYKDPESRAIQLVHSTQFKDNAQSNSDTGLSALEPIKNALKIESSILDKINDCCKLYEFTNVSVLCVGRGW